ncbi:OLC1v1021438C1 [Oldenlandia corymbosa var. corymbosa]|uniref:OLC1v1021438C1 n=1 Tax=Oldenlandia corymbosa var. corymbosa TaxID=529605 RepID=A0AAV1BW94_OLDCO|nr:OLC1v1021438C1 [Oldenlandia corymbosa var. corymbosa]
MKSSQKMANISPHPLLLLTFAALFILNSPATIFAEKEVSAGGLKPASKSQNERYRAVNELCNQRTSREAIDFCTKALKSDRRSAYAKDNVSLLLISVDLARGEINRTRDYYASILFKLQNKKSSKFVLALKDCVSAYDWGNEELSLIPTELRKGPAFAGYDAKIAHDALQRCTDTLNQHKISNHSVLARHRNSTDYVQLCVDITLAIK